ncbi:MAG: GTP-binding protein [Acidimicrobiales bacterium]|nr:GTP-binding protein [Acidimicrobiales bacterium]
MTDLFAGCTRLLDEAVERVGTHPVADEVREARTRLAEPLRVAVAGRVKAGKSTLVNAMVGELVAPTDARECTKVVTWYRDGVTYRVEGVEGGGSRVPLRFDRRDGALEVDLNGRSAASLQCIEVTWPSALLRKMVLVDTPGIGSSNEDVSARTERFLERDHQAAPADAVVYLLRHVHQADVGFLEAFHDDALASANPLNALGVLSRADEIGVARPDAMASAQRIAARWRSDRRLSALVQNVVPVAGLLAEGARTLRQDEYDDMAALARADEALVDEILISVDRFAGSSAPVGTEPELRRRLLERYGLFGCRQSVEILRRGLAPNAQALADELLVRSGLPALRRDLDDRFSRRAGLLKARQALFVVHRAAAALGDAELAGSVERLLSQAHELSEIRVLNLIHQGALPLADGDLDSARVLLGERGLDPAVRAGLAGGTDLVEVRAALGEEHARWQARAGHPLASPEVASAATVLVRTCEGLIAALTSP